MPSFDPEILRSEIYDLRKKISQLELLRKRIKAMEDLLATYEEDAGSSEAINISSKTLENRSPQSSEHPPQFTNVRPFTAERLRAAWTAIAERGGAVPTHELVSALEKQGIEIGGQDKVATLSATLSHSPYFKTLGRNRGWAIKNAEDGESDES